MKSLFDEENKLKLIDLTGRLPYGVKVQYENKPFGIDWISSLYEEVKLDISDNYSVGLSEIKPYLRSMSSMTEEEDKEYRNIDNRAYSCPKDYAHIPAKDRIDWLLKNHFDFRGLIPKGLAIEVTKENNPYEIRSRE